MNNEKFGYNKFDFLYSTDADSLSENLVKLNEKLREFFSE